MDETFEIDQEMMNQSVVLGLRPIVNTPNGPGYIAVECILRRVEKCSVFVETNKGTVLGAPGKISVPKSTLQFVNLVKSVVTATSLPTA